MKLQFKPPTRITPVPAPSCCPEACVRPGNRSSQGERHSSREAYSPGTGRLLGREMRRRPFSTWPSFLTNCVTTSTGRWIGRRRHIDAFSRLRWREGAPLRPWLSPHSWQAMAHAAWGGDAAVSGNHAEAGKTRPQDPRACPGAPTVCITLGMSNMKALLWPHQDNENIQFASLSNAANAAFHLTR